MTAKPIAAVLLIEMILFCSCVSAQRRQDVAVVVHAENPINVLSLAELRKILAGEKHSWPGGVPIVVVLRTPGTRERTVLMKLLRMSESDYKQHWVAQILRGEVASEPIVVPSVGMQREALLTFPGAITMVDASDLKTGMKVLKIDGHLPGEADYSLY